MITSRVIEYDITDKISKEEKESLRTEIQGYQLESQALVEKIEGLNIKVMEGLAKLNRGFGKRKVNAIAETDDKERKTKVYYNGNVMEERSATDDELQTTMPLASPISLEQEYQQPKQESPPLKPPPVPKYGYHLEEQIDPDADLSII